MKPCCSYECGRYKVTVKLESETLRVSVEEKVTVPDSKSKKASWRPVDSWERDWRVAASQIEALSEWLKSMGVSKVVTKTTKKVRDLCPALT